MARAASFGMMGHVDMIGTFLLLSVIEVPIKTILRRFSMKPGTGAISDFRNRREPVLKTHHRTIGVENDAQSKRH
jgi:hypothetical protein